MRIAILAGLWLVLFGVAALVGRSLKDDQTTEASAATQGTRPASLTSQDEARRAGWKALASKPRKSSGQIVELGGIDSRFAELNTELSGKIVGNKDAILSCVKNARLESTSPTDFLEISFVIQPNELLGVNQLGQLSLERTTIFLSPAEERCFLDALGQLRFHSVSTPHERVFYPICIHSIYKEQFQFGKSVEVGIQSANVVKGEVIR